MERFILEVNGSNKVEVNDYEVSKDQLSSVSLLLTLTSGIDMISEKLATQIVA